LFVIGEGAGRKGLQFLKYLEKIMFQLFLAKIKCQQTVTSRYMDEQIKEINLLDKNKAIIFFSCSSKIAS
jgi:hypothetical protein